MRTNLVYTVTSPTEVSDVSLKQERVKTKDWFFQQYLEVTNTQIHKRHPNFQLCSAKGTEVIIEGG